MEGDYRVLSTSPSAFQKFSSQASLLYSIEYDLPGPLEIPANLLYLL